MNIFFIHKKHPYSYLNIFFNRLIEVNTNEQEKKWQVTMHLVFLNDLLFNFLFLDSGLIPS